MIADFHFIRPLWLLALLPLALLWLLLRRHTDPVQQWRSIVAPHLLPFLLSDLHSSQASKKKGFVSFFTPLNLMAVGWLLTVIAIAGPTWHREPAPFSDDTAALAIVVKVSDSMLTEDIQPSRLARATEKIHDLLALRPGAKAILIAYSGSAHVAMPATTDSGIIDTFAQSLSPKIMPVDGDVAADALALAEHGLVKAGGGSILWITDAVASDQTAALAKWRKTTRTPVYLLPPLPSGSERDQLVSAARAVDAHTVTLSADDTDVRSLAGLAKFSETTATATDADARWAESGYWITPLLALIFLPYFRRSWMLATAARER